MLSQITRTVSGLFATVERYVVGRFISSDTPPIVLVGILYGIAVATCSLLLRYAFAGADWAPVAPYATAGGYVFHIIVGIVITACVAMFQVAPGGVPHGLTLHAALTYPVALVTAIGIAAIPDYTRIFGSTMNGVLFSAIMPVNTLWMSPLLRWARLRSMGQRG